MSIDAYRRTLREVESPRQIERRLMSNITGRLDSVADRFDDAVARHERLMLLATGLRTALAENQKLWSATDSGLGRFFIIHPDRGKRLRFSTS